MTAPHVVWIFAQRLAGHSVAGIARALNERNVPCPSRVDPERNRHRTGQAWTLRTVAAILANPRYTGRQVWNRQHTDRLSGSGVDEDEHLPAPADGGVRAYQLTGLLRCSHCGRQPDSHWVHGRAAYRCRRGRTSAEPADLGRPRFMYVREDHALAYAAAETGQDRSRVAPHLAANDLIIVCGLSTFALTSSQAAPMAGPAGHDQRRGG
jgi:hypothetical protein